MAAAEQARTARSHVIRSEAYVVLAWARLMRGERLDAERAASIARRMRSSDSLLTTTLVIASGGPSTGAASALASVRSVLSLVGAARVVADHGRLADVRAEIAGLPPDLERSALQRLQVGLVAQRDTPAVDDIADRLAELGQPADRYVEYASVLGRLGTTDLALGFLHLAAERGYGDVAAIDADVQRAGARARPAFATIRQRLVANAGDAKGETSPTDQRVP